MGQLHVRSNARLKYRTFYMRDTIVIAGSIAHKPWHGGHTWVFLQYLLGFKKLGWDVVFIDWLPIEESGLAASRGVHYFREVMNAFHPEGDFALLYDNCRKSLGLSRERVLERVARSALLLNVMGFLQDEEILQAAPKRAFLDIDPGFGQMWQALGLCTIFRDNDYYLTIGENIGDPSCQVPTCGLQWIATRPPVQLDYWPVHKSGATHFTSVASWRGAYGPIPYKGRTYGLRVHEFRKFFPLPVQSHGRFELALSIDPSDAADRERLETSGWHLIEPRSVAADPWQYRDFVQQSGAEFTVAKNMYVDTQSGWFSDRTVCYLASGKPVLVQDTGIRHLNPSGKGLLTFRSLEDAVEGVREIVSNYAVHSAGAREVAAELFDSGKVLSRLLKNLSIN